jgi:hypothetical protein
MWRDVTTTNKANILRQLDGLIAQLNELRELIASDDARLVDELRSARDEHRSWIAKIPGPASTPSFGAQPPGAGSRGTGWLDRLRRG